MKHTPNWAYVKKSHITRNMRAQCDETEFAKWLLKLGNNELPVKGNQPYEGCIAIPVRCITDYVVTSVFGNQFKAYSLADHLILFPTNDESLRLNEVILQ